MTVQDTASIRLSIAGLSEISDFESRDVSHVVSLIDPEEPAPPSLPALQARSHLMLRMHDVIDEHLNLRAPNAADVEDLVTHADRIASDRIDHLLVHCHMGRSRSTAAAAIMLYRLGAGTPGEIFGHIAAIRDPIWPNSRMLSLADDMLDTGGALLAACRPIYRDVADRHAKWIAPFVHSTRMRDLTDSGLIDPDAPDVAIE